MTRIWKTWLALAIGLTVPAAAQPVPGFVTLGTAGGPVARPDRSQPANLLITPAGGRFLVDVGDGAAERLAAAGLQSRQIDGVFISHLHLDHVGGLQAVIGLRWMMEAPTPLTIYGPPGTQELVDGLVASIKPSARIGFGLGAAERDPAEAVRVVVLRDRAELKVADMRVRAVSNTHFGAGDGVSLSYRFDLPQRAIGYTGDTGPSPTVARLFAGVDLMVSEVIDLAGTVAESRRLNAHLTAESQRQLEAHLAAHHLTPEAAGAMAAAAGARQLVFTHLAVPGPTAAAEPALRAGAGATFKGTVSVARDLDRF